MSTNLDARPKRLTLIALLGAVAFAAFYFSVNFLQTTPLPLPNAPDGEVYHYFATERVTGALIAVAQLLSVGGLAVFVTNLQRGPFARPRTAWVGLSAVAAMVVSVGLSLVLALAAPQMSVGAVVAVRQASFLFGGVVHVVLLGAYVGLVSRAATARGLRVFGVIAMVPALVSLVSLVWFYGNAFILLGRLLCIAWTVVAGVALVLSARRAVR